MRVVSALRALGPIDVQSVRRDSLLRWMALLPLAFGLLLRVLVPFIAAQVQAQFAFDITPYYAIVAGLMLLLLAGGWPTVVLVAVGLAPLASSLAGGLSVTAWQQLVMKTIPVRRRPMLFGLRDVIGCLLGIAAGLVVKWTLEAWPGSTGYALLYLMVFAVLAASYAVFAAVHECGRHPPIPERRATLGENVRIIPSLLRADRRYTRYLIAGMLVNGLFIMMPFLAIHAREVTGQPESFLGELVMATMVGAMIGNLVAGQTSARLGCKPALVSSRMRRMPSLILALPPVASAGTASSSRAQACASAGIIARPLRRVNGQSALRASRAARRAPWASA